MPSPPSEDFSVLLVDDDPGARLTLGDILEMHGYQVLVADTGRAALDVVRTNRAIPGLALLDLQLPDMNGLDLPEMLRQHAPELQVVIMTGHASLESALSAIRNDTADYLVKPISPSNLINAIEEGRSRWRSARVESAILGSLERFRAVIENLNEVVTVVDPGGSIVYESPAVKRLFGYEVSERLGWRFDRYVHQADRRLVARCMTKARDGVEGARCTIRARSADGNWKSVEISASCIVKEAPIEGLILTSRDVTEQLQLEAQLRQAQKMEAIGQLSGGIAHELNNLLTVVTANSEAAFQELSPDSHLYQDIKDAYDAARHGARLIQQLLGFSRRERLCPKPTDVVQLVQRTAQRVQRTLPDTTSLLLSEKGTPSPVAVADPDAVEQTLINLINNARDAMPRGGDIEIAVQQVDIDEHFVARHPGASPGEYVCLAVRDNGAGMDPNIVDRIFEPFFSTKSISSGTGLGMAMVYGLTKQQKGYIDVASTPGMGTTVSVYLPATAEPPVTTFEHVRMTTHQRAHEHSTILVVEDQQKLREVSRRVLERLGYEVTTAADGAEAMTRLDEMGYHADLIVADVVMPKMGGMELHDALEAKGIKVPMLFMSGFSAQDVREGKPLDPHFRLLQKPWTVDELASAVESALESGIHESMRDQPPCGVN